MHTQQLYNPHASFAVDAILKVNITVCPSLVARASRLISTSRPFDYTRKRERYRTANGILGLLSLVGEGRFSTVFCDLVWTVGDGGPQGLLLRSPASGCGSVTVKDDSPGVDAPHFKALFACDTSGEATRHRPQYIHL